MVVTSDKLCRMDLRLESFEDYVQIRVQIPF